MKHRRLTAATLAVNGEHLPLLYADVVVIDRDNCVEPDWECVAATRTEVDLELAPCAIEMVTVEGARVLGDALVVRSDGRGHVFRGAGPLSGVGPWPASTGTVDPVTTSEPPRVDLRAPVGASGRRVALFDIDGTLIRAGDTAHREAFERALRDVYGVPATLAGISLGGMLDRQIARHALAPFALDPAAIEDHLDHLMDVMGGHYLTLAGEGPRRPELLPGLPQVGDALAAAGVTLAVVTGSAEPVARAKLAWCGLAELFPIGAYGDQADHRGTLVSMGLAAAGAHVGYRFDPTEAVVVGDTPRDIDAARHAGTRVIAVASGVFPRAQLADAAPDALFDDLSATDDVVAAVLGAAALR